MAIVPLRRLFFAVVLLGFGGFQATGHAHRLPPEVTAFFKAEAPRLRVLVRVPTAILSDAGLPRRGASLLDLEAIDTRLAAIADEVVRNLDVTDAGRPLVPEPARWMVSVVGDRSFASYDTALAHIAGPPLPVERPVYWDEAYIDLQLDYPLAGAEPDIAARLNGLGVGSDFVQTRATYLPAAGGPRVIMVSGPPQRVPFEPPLATALTSVLRPALDEVVSATLVWLVVVCLAISGGGGRALAGFLVAQAAALAMVALRQSPLSEPVTDLVLFVWAALVVAAAARAVIGGGAGSLTVLGVLSGICAGTWLGSRLHEILPLAGSYRVPVVAMNVLAIGALVVLLFLIVQPLIRAAFGWRAPAWLVTAVWAAVPAHEASHVMMLTGGRLAGEPDWLLPPTVAALSTHGPLLAAAVFLLVAWLATRSRRPLPASEGAAS